MTSIFTELVHHFIKCSAEDHCRYVENKLVASGWYLLVGLIVVSLTYSPCPFSILSSSELTSVSSHDVQQQIRMLQL